MKRVTISLFVLLIVQVTSDGDVESLEKNCVDPIERLMTENPIQKCDYMSDAIRCAIRRMKLWTGITQTQRQNVTNWANDKLTNESCTTTTFDSISQKVTAVPELLELQRCFDVAIGKKSWSCQRTEDAVRCALFGDLNLIAESPPLNVLGYTRMMSDRYLDDMDCWESFDDIRNRLINASAAVSSTLWLAALMVGLTMMVNGCDGWTHYDS